MEHHVVKSEVTFLLYRIALLWANSYIETKKKEKKKSAFLIIFKPLSLIFARQIFKATAIRLNKVAKKRSL